VIFAEHFQALFSGHGKRVDVLFVAQVLLRFLGEQSDYNLRQNIEDITWKGELVVVFLVN
jgi:hypothetical protein